MRRPLIPVVGVACLLAGLVLPVTGQERKAKTAPKTSDLEYMGLEDFNLQTNEDLEILGEVLRAHLTGLYPPYAYHASCRECHAGPIRKAGRRNLFDPLAVMVPHFESWPQRPSRDCGLNEALVGRPEGVYLQGYGVVYQVRLDVPPPEEERPKGPAKEPDEDSAPSRSWENAKRSLRGQLPLEPLGLDLNWGMPTKADLVNKLLDVLAENAGNFRHLKLEDRLTVAITFPRSKPSAAGYGDYGDEGGAVFGAGGAAGYSGYEDEGGSSGYGDAAAYDAAFEDGEYGFDMEDDAYAASPRARYGTDRRAAGSHEVSGDLHMRQGNYQKAIEAYGKALKAAGSSNAERAMVRKLIQAHVAAGELEVAEKLIEELREGQSKSQNKTAPPPSSGVIPLPARLVVSVTKSQLDEVAAGKMSREELREHAGGYYFNPPRGTPGLGSGKSRSGWLLPSDQRSRAYEKKAVGD